MTKSITLPLVTAAVFAALASAPAVSGQSNSLPCSAVTYHQDFIRAYPNAPAACRDVVERNGMRQVHFVAAVAGNDNGKVTLNFLNARNQPIENSKPLIFTPRPDVNLTVNGAPKKVAELQKGDKLDFWVPEGRLGLVTDPSSDALNDLSL
ncbi:MAG: hypothetical protein LBE59_09355 [Nevskiaceae bacterium]|jgi:hypothetical protein|nr:hypothetical protein [Nevskiaceae bacterium]